MRHETNDDNDDGYPDGEVVRWEDTWKDARAACASVGISRIGLSGVRVCVRVDGKVV